MRGCLAGASQAVCRL